MLKRVLLPALMLAIALIGPVTAQDSTVYIILEGSSILPCEDSRVSIPVYMHTPVEVGGFTVQIIMTDPSWFRFDPDDTLAVDTIGACHTTWGTLNWFVHPYGHSVTVTAIGPGGQNLPPTDTCLIFTVHGNYVNKQVSDTCQLINFGTTQVSRPDGSGNWDRNLVRDSLCVDACDTNLVRGDANYNGALNGLDVIFLVGYFKGGPSVCLGCPCLADANADGNVNGLDVVFLVNYFKGGAAPNPPNCPIE